MLLALLLITLAPVDFIREGAEGWKRLRERREQRGLRRLRKQRGLRRLRKLRENNLPCPPYLPCPFSAFRL
jgi:hypothetical protein